MFRRTLNVLSVESTKCRAFKDLQSMNRKDPKFYKILETRLSLEVVGRNLPLAKRARSVFSA